jgi:hypothetical protein
MAQSPLAPAAFPVLPAVAGVRLAAVSAGGMALTAAMRIFALNYLVSCIADLPPSPDGLLSGLHAEQSALAQNATVPAEG